ncbi:MAG: DUF418 domain-containing protein, partial [Nitriliruptoraceae bacterium]
GIDLARSLAIFGMFAVHVGPTDAQGWLGRIYAAPHGRASLLFVLVAGAGVSLLAASPRTSTPRTLGSLLWRTVLLLPLGLALQELDHGAAVILQDYAVLFVVAAVAVFLPDRWLLALAGVALPLGSVGFLWGHLSEPGVFDRGAVALSQPVGDIVHGLVLSGPYPLITWLAPFLFGMWLGRRDLRSSVVRRRMLVGGTFVAIAAMSTSRLLRDLLDANGEPAGWEHLAVDTAHSQMPLWLIGSTAAAVVVLSLSLRLADAAPGLARPLVHTGQLSLTVYVGHLLALHAAPGLLTSGVVTSAAAILGLFVLVSVVFAHLWRRSFARGPLELTLHLPWWRR